MCLFEFYYFGKYLTTSVTIYGEFAKLTKNKTGTKIDMFYHGTSEALIFSDDKNICYRARSDGLTINSPCSTSSSKAVALNFSNDNQGLVVSFKVQGMSKCASVAWLSDYSNEEEYLFIDATLIIMDIDDCTTMTHYKPIFDAITVIDGSIGKEPYDQIKDNTAYELASILIEHQLSAELSQYKAFDTLHSYGKKVIERFCSE
eukprot:26443_1